MLNKLFVIIAISLSISLVFVKEFLPSDPDIWWHMNVGRSILQNKNIIFQDIYTYTMPNRYWIDWEWLLNILYFLFYKVSNNNFILLSITFLTMSILSFYNTVNHLKKDIIFHFCIFFSIASSLACLGLKAQVVSLFFTSIVYYILKQNKIKLYILLPLLFLLWANMHGAFILILGVLFFDLIFTYKKTKLFKYKFIIYSLSFFATFINPYGIKLYIESFKVILDERLHKYIIEFQPTDPLVFIPFCIFTGILYYGLLRKFISQNKFKLNIKTWELIMILICTYFAFKSKRHIGLFTLISLSAFIQIVQIIFYDIRKYFSVKNLYYNKVFSLIFLVCLNIYLLVVFCPKKSLEFEDNNIKSYPYNGLNYIKQNNIKENILSEYHWGGFIAWQNPEVKIFIDGRMPIWDNILEDYIKAINYNEYIINKYNIKYILRDKSIKYNPMHWELIYKDEVCVLLKKLSK